MSALPHAEIRSENDLHGLALGQIISRMRTERAWNQGRLALKAGVTQPTISRIENGAMPDALKLRRIAEALDTTSDALLGEVEQALARAKAAAKPTLEKGDTAEWWKAVMVALGPIALIALIVFGVAAVMASAKRSGGGSGA